jgi:hypothetical protein
VAVLFDTKWDKNRIEEEILTWKMGRFFELKIGRSVRKARQLGMEGRVVDQTRRKRAKLILDD